METTIGIVADNYKLDKFKKELKKKGLTNIEVVPFGTKDTSTIKIITDSSNVEMIKTVCEKVERHFKIMKN